MNARASGFAVALAVLAVGSACDRGTRSDVSRETAAAVDKAGDAISDSRITMTVQSKYFASNEVKGHEIDVDTDHSVVTLKGKVDSENARQQAVQIARGVDGVTRVEDQLTISSDGDRVAARTGEPERSPGWITTKIQAQYYVHPGLKPWNIDVTTSPNGVVTLAGEIDSAADRAEAVKIASATDGVTRVEDQLHRKGEVASTATGSVERTAERAGGAAGDAWITSKIQSRYFVDNDVKGRNIDVDTSNGVVTLKGTVNSHSEHNQAVAVARNTDGVREVRDQLQMTPENHDVRGTVGREASKVGREASKLGEKASHEASKAGEKVSQEASKAGQHIEDAWITAKIQSKYFLNSDIKSRKIDVDTKNGVVTLNGAVGTPAARDMAMNLARETDGVTNVVNNLKVDPLLK
jgi:hyperosmotically inducible periplasmic protein